MWDISKTKRGIINPWLDGCAPRPLGHNILSLGVLVDSEMFQQRVTTKPIKKSCTLWMSRPNLIIQLENILQGDVGSMEPLKYVTTR